MFCFHLVYIMNVMLVVFPVKCICLLIWYLRLCLIASLSNLRSCYEGTDMIHVLYPASIFDKFYSY